MAQVGNGTLAVYSDITCPWATVLLHRLRRARHDLGIDVVIDVRPYPLEIVNSAPTPYDVARDHTALAADVEPELGMSPWDAPPEEFPVTSLLALEAVRSCYATSPDCAEELDAALRRAFFVDHRCISMFHVIIDVAKGCDVVDSERLQADLRRGRARADVFENLNTALDLGVEGSPHVFLHKGEDQFLPSLQLDTTEDGTTRVVRDDPGAVDELLLRASETRQGD